MNMPLPEDVTHDLSDDMTDFGYRQVAKADKASLVRQVFTSVAPRYDVMNDLMSLGIHRVWKRIFIQTLQPRPGKRLLDLAGGTGDISFGWLGAGGGSALLTDINPSMLQEGRRRAVSAGRIGAVTCAVVDAEKIPLPDRCVDTVSIAFGLRNCTDKAAVLREARRVLKPGGLFACLEFSHVQIAALSPLYDLWSFKVLPRLGAMVAGDEESYRYLAESIRTFPRAEELVGMMRDAGLERSRFRLLSGGIVAIHTGQVL
jgi:demethylmenaquinone methyltransferase/2-methoxy-6-polyprenyl-1,4-benzoquinol methylase